eukprot:3808001-Pyramimonas_sp.AAC.1
MASRRLNTSSRRPKRSLSGVPRGLPQAKTSHSLRKACIFNRSAPSFFIPFKGGQEAPKITPRRPGRPSRPLKDGPRALQEGTRNPQDGPRGPMIEVHRGDLNGNFGSPAQTRPRTAPTSPE